MYLFLHCTWVYIYDASASIFYTSLNLPFSSTWHHCSSTLTEKHLSGFVLHTESLLLFLWTETIGEVQARWHTLSCSSVYVFACTHLCVCVCVCACVRACLTTCSNTDGRYSKRHSPILLLHLILWQNAKVSLLLCPCLFFVALPGYLFITMIYCSLVFVCVWWELFKADRATDSVTSLSSIWSCDKMPRCQSCFASSLLLCLLWVPFYNNELVLSCVWESW